MVINASDFEHEGPRHDRILRDHAENADMLIMDAQYTARGVRAEETVGPLGTWLEAVRVASDRKLQQLVLFQHDPSHADDHGAYCSGCPRHFESTVPARDLTARWMFEIEN